MDSDNLCKGEEFKRFLEMQCAEIQKHKWIESEKAGYDLGNIAVRDWITKHAKEYREFYSKRLSKSN